VEHENAKKNAFSKNAPIIGPKTKKPTFKR
jgi:hypothetical protein